MHGLKHSHRCTLKKTPAVACARFFGIFSVFIAACSGGGTTTIGDSSDTSSATSFTGTWSGTWESRSGVGGSFSLTSTASGSVYTGPVTLTGSPCLAGGTFSATVRGEAFNGMFMAGEATATLDGTLTPGALNGTYAVGSNAGACADDTGTLSLSQQTE